MQDFSNPELHAGCIERFTIDRGNKKDMQRERGMYIGASEL